MITHPHCPGTGQLVRVGACNGLILRWKRARSCSHTHPKTPVQARVRLDSEFEGLDKNLTIFVADICFVYTDTSTSPIFMQQGGYPTALISTTKVSTMFFKRVHRYLIAFISLTGGIIGYVVSDLSAGAVTGLLIGAVVGALVAVSVLDDNQVPRRYDE